jgi:hypothetical protein
MGNLEPTVLPKVPKVLAEPNLEPSRTGRNHAPGPGSYLEVLDETTMALCGAVLA